MWNRSKPRKVLQPSDAERVQSSVLRLNERLTARLEKEYKRGFSAGSDAEAKHFDTVISKIIVELHETANSQNLVVQRDAYHNAANIVHDYASAYGYLQPLEDDEVD